MHDEEKIIEIPTLPIIICLLSFTFSVFNEGIENCGTGLLIKTDGIFSGFDFKPSHRTPIIMTKVNIGTKNLIFIF